MMLAPAASAWLEVALAWLTLALEIFALIVCLRYVRLSVGMPFLVLAFTGFTTAAMSVLATGLAVRWNVLPDEFGADVRIIAATLEALASGLLAFGLLLVLRDVRDRLHFVNDARRTNVEPARDI